MRNLFFLLMSLVTVLAACGGTAPAPAADPGPPPAAQQEPPYEPDQLQKWYARLNQHTWEVRAITYSSIDTHAGHIRYGVTTMEGKERLEAVLRKAGVPPGAVVIDLPAGALSEAAPLKGCRLTDPPSARSQAPYRLMLSHTPLRPGETFTLAVAGAKPHELTRGIDAYLECWDGAAWSPRYTLFSDRGADGPSTVIYSPNRVIIDIGFDASRPGRYALPAELEPGWYRIRLRVSGTENGYHKPYELWALVEVHP